MDYTYLVTGSDGHLGSWVVKELLKRGKKVRGLRLPSSTYKTPKIEEVYYGDVTKVETLNEFFDVEKAKVIHTAGIITLSSKMTKALYDVNVQGSINILNLCKKHDFPLTYVSSVHAFSDIKGKVDENSTIDPETVKGPYAKTKAITTLLMKEARKDLGINIVFPSGILGPDDYGKNHLNSVIKDRIDGKLYAYLNGGYNMVDVRDVASFIAELAISSIINEDYIISNDYITVKDFLEKVGSFIKNKKKLIKIPTLIAKIVAPLSEIYYKLLKKPALFCSYSIFTLINCPQFSHSKASTAITYIPRSIDETIRDIINGFKQENTASNTHI